MVCGNKPVAEATDHNQDAGSTTSQPKCDKKNNRGNNIFDILKIICLIKKSCNICGNKYFPLL